MSRGRNESGHAPTEALLVGLVLFVPLLWLLSVSAELHAAALAVSSAAREAGFDAARSVDPLEADSRVATVVDETVSAHGLDSARAHVTWTPADGWRRGGAVEVVVSYRVAAFQLPLVGVLSEPALTVTGRHVAVVDRYRSRG